MDSNIVLEINGHRIAVARSFKATKKWSKYYIKLSDVTSYGDFFKDSCSSINLIVRKPDRNLIFAECEVTSFVHTGTNNITEVSMVSYKRMEVC